MTAIFSTTVTQTKRDAGDINLRGRAISQASRQNTKRPGWNAPDKYVEPTGISGMGRTVRASPQMQQIPYHTKERDAIKVVIVRPNTKRGDKGGPRPKWLSVAGKTIDQFYAAKCEFLLTENRLKNLVLFEGVRQTTGGEICITGCGWFNDGHCPAYRKLTKQEAS